MLNSPKKKIFFFFFLYYVDKSDKMSRLDKVCSKISGFNLRLCLEQREMKGEERKGRVRFFILFLI